MNKIPITSLPLPILRIPDVSQLSSKEAMILYFNLLRHPAIGMGRTIFLCLLLFFLVKRLKKNYSIQITVKKR